MNNKLNICQVSLLGNIPIIKKNYYNFKKIYKDINLFIIVPKKNKKIFKKKLNFSDIFIVDEERIINFSNFKKISNKYLASTNYFKDIQKRLGWYYQQILKISFIYDFIEKRNENIIIWDADTIIIKKINFFNKNLSNNYGTTSYFHRAYYETNKSILKKLPPYYISSLAQFISITPKEQKFLKKKLSQNKKLGKKFSETLTHIVMKTVSSTHKKYNGSLFSEYELIGQSNLLLKYDKQKLVSGMRDHLNGQLNYLQTMLLVILGFKYIAYEHTHPNVNSKNMLKRKQTWLKFIKLLIKKLTNNIYRGFKHHINYFFKSIRANI